MRAWGEYTDAGCSRHEVDGDHYFVAARYRDVVRIVGDALLDAADAGIEGGLLGAEHSWLEGAV